MRYANENPVMFYLYMCLKLSSDKVSCLKTHDYVSQCYIVIDIVIQELLQADELPFCVKKCRTFLLHDMGMSSSANGKNICFAKKYENDFDLLVINNIQGCNWINNW